MSGRISLEKVKRIMTRPFSNDSELITFMKRHIEELYEEFYKAEQEGDDSLMDYVQGSIDTTHVYLIKSGEEKYMTYEQFLDIVTAEWKPVR